MDIKSASDYYEYKADSSSKIKSMADEISRLNQEIADSRLESAIDRYVTRNGGTEDVIQFVFNQLKDSKVDIESIPETVENMRANLGLKAWFSGTSIMPNPSPEGRRFRQSWE